MYISNGDEQNSLMSCDTMSYTQLRPWPHVFRETVGQASHLFLRPHGFGRDRFVLQDVLVQYCFQLQIVALARTVCNLKFCSPKARGNKNHSYF
jgi:hypothetical protein